ncbi:Aspartyl protease inhibitor [Toxocara canis]|uniref:Aspartyl protease inhibitor n=1 Tax=Toxocara canis TaxID=6265 RepID=A0A0B2V7F9_TOXCA|nr:Aspartyl protease inhibitor [Toxocara canis]
MGGQIVMAGPANGNKLFFNDIFIRELNKDEQKENEKFEKDMKAHNEAVEKADHNGGTEAKLLVDAYEVPSFCRDLEQVDLGDCFALGGKLYKDNKKVRDLSEKEKKQVEEYLKKLEKYYDDVYAKSDEDFDWEKVIAGEPKGPQLCN